MLSHLVIYRFAKDSIQFPNWIMRNYWTALMVCYLLLLNQEGNAHDGSHSRTELGEECVDISEARTKDLVHNRCANPVALMWFCLSKTDSTIYHRSSEIISSQGFVKLGCAQEGTEFSLSWGACAPLGDEKRVMITASSNIGAARNLTDIDKIDFSCQVLE